MDNLRELTEGGVQKMGLKLVVVVERRLRTNLRKLGNDNVREGSRLFSASKPPRNSEDPQVAVVAEVILESADKLNAPVQIMVFGDTDVYFGELQHTVEECTKNDGSNLGDEYYHVAAMRSVEIPMPEKKVVRDQGHEGVTPHQYSEMDAAKDANLNEAGVVVLRLYTGPLFRPWNKKALRDKEGPKEWATCIAVYKHLRENSSVLKLMKNAPPGWLMCCWYEIACFCHVVSFR
jgi:hypothetical protein